MEIPGYRIISELGRGGMAVVYLAEQLKFGREVALKVMSQALGEDTSFQTRFLREARTLAQTSHPNIVTVYDVDVHEDYHYFSMEYHTGGDLKQRLRRGMTTGDALRVTREMAGALQRAHECGIIHRDIKPGNILFARDGRAILTDFGIARNYDNETQLTQLGSMVGTPRYMSPEQARGQDLGGPSDIYSLGVVLYEMLAGAPPFQAEDSIALGIKHVSEPVPALPEKRRQFQPLVEWLMAKEPEQRPASGEVLAAELARIERELPAAKADEALTIAQPSDAATRVSGSAGALPGKKGLWPWGAAGLAAASAVIGAVMFWPGKEAGTPQASPTTAQAEATRSASTANTQVTAWLEQGDQALAADRLMTPEDDNAVGWYRQVLALNPDNTDAQQGLERVAQRYVSLARQELGQRDNATARTYAERARQIDPQAYGLAALDAELAKRAATNSQRQQQLVDLGTQLRISGLLGSARSAAEEGNDSEAVKLYQEVLELDPSNREAQTGLTRLK